ncbi:MAG: Plug domain-containing protein, partial [Alphaproteobacteria bacterium]|nr:Plug domain-containing protein [Alphaproteobacteria bacterium]
MTAFSIESLREKNIGNVYDLAQFTPNYKEIPQLGRRLDRPTIRGQAGTNVFGEANASYFIDGVYVSGSLSTATFDSLQRVEVIRGPQSAIF